MMGNATDSAWYTLCVVLDWPVPVQVGYCARRGGRHIVASLLVGLRQPSFCGRVVDAFGEHLVR